MRYLVTGGTGFLGGHVVDVLQARGHYVYVGPHSLFDLMVADDRRDLLNAAKPEVVVHLAADVGGIGLNAEHPGRLFYNNAIMGLELMEACRRYGVETFLSVGTACEYPAHLGLLEENKIWDGYPIPVTAPYGMAKKMLLVMGQGYRDEYGFDARHVIPTNLYGPNDHFDEEYGHVIPSIIKKVADAVHYGRDMIELWGTGNATRDFLYVTDAAEGIVRAAEVETLEGPVNLGTGVETSIHQVAEEIANQYGWVKGLIAFNADKPDGQKRRVMSVEPAEELLDWRAETPLGKGIDQTIDYYENKIR